MSLLSIVESGSNKITRQNAKQCY